MHDTHSTAASLNALYDRRELWRGRLHRPASAALSTGFPALDDALHAGGWPDSGLMELLCVPSCPQALRLLMPALAARQDGLLVLANPPARPRADTLHQAGIHTGKLLVMRSADTDTLLRACREAAASGVASTLVMWMPRGTDTPANLRRLHLAARQGRCLLVVLRHADQALQPSPAPLRVLVRAEEGGDLALEIVKQPGGWGGQRVSLKVLPERLTSPLAPTVEMPVPPTQRATGFRDPDSRFAPRWPAPTRRPLVASPPGHTLTLPW